MSHKTGGRPSLAAVAGFRLQGSLNSAFIGADFVAHVNDERSIGSLDGVKLSGPSRQVGEMGPAGKTGSAWTLIFLGDVAFLHYEARLARSIYEEAVGVLREPGDINFLAYAIRRLGQLLWHEGDNEAAFTLCKESLNLNQQVGDPRGTIACLAGLAAIAAAQGRFERAAKLMAAVDTQLASIGIRLLFIDQLEYARNLADLRAKLDEKNFNKFWAKGKRMSLDDAIALALEKN